MSQMYLLRTVVFSVACITLSFPVSAQKGKIDSIFKSFDRYRTENLQEKVYVHTDRNFYLTGETLWLKVYYLDGTLHRPLDVSKVAYVEILDSHNNSVLHIKVALDKGTGSGSIFIPASITSGEYTLRAYTQWMKNFSPAFFFHKGITIVNPFIKVEPDKETTSAEKKVLFFPEGGNLVNGLTSRVALSVNDASGNPVNYQGKVLDSSNDTIASFSTLSAGTASFHITPEAGKTYKVMLLNDRQEKSFHNLPDAFDKGYVLSLSDTAQYVKVLIQNNLRTSPYLYLFVHARQMIVHAEARGAFGNRIAFLIDKNKLGEGINHFTLFNEDLNPVCERLYFRHPSKKLAVNVRQDQQQYGVRRKVRLELETTSDQKPVVANLSMAVYKLDSLSTEENSGIFDYVWLTSDLDGTVSSPEYYFSQSADSETALDNLMLTKGWRRFNWDHIFSKNNRHEFFPEYRGHIIHGKVTDDEGKPLQGKLVYLSSPGKVVRLYPSASDLQGMVKFETIHLWGNRQVTALPADSTVKVLISNPLSENFGPFPKRPFQLSSALNTALVSRTISMQVQDIYNENSRDRYILPKIDSSAFYGKADETYLLDNYTRFPVMEEVMREYVPGVLVRKRRDGFHFIVLDMVNKSVMRERPLLLLDGVPFFDADRIMNFDPRKVKKLEVVTKPYYLGSQTFNGIVSYTTYEGDLSGFQLDPNTVVMDYEGLQLQREFLSPEYTNQKQYHDRTPDQRTLLLWLPQAATNKNGKLEVEFYTSDADGNFLVKVEGLTEDGEAGTGSATFSVKRLDN